MEPIYTLILAAVLLKEYQDLSLNYYIGASIILGAVFGNAFLNSRKRQNSQINKPKN